MPEQLHAGKLKGVSTDVWHTKEMADGQIVYWCGSWHDRTPPELFSECVTILADLIRNHPGIEIHGLVKEVIYAYQI